MTVLFIIPIDEILAKCPADPNAAKPLRELGTVLEGLELCLRERIIVADMWPAMGCRHRQICRQLAHGF
jgi:hypothetical protein